MLQTDHYRAKLEHELAALRSELSRIATQDPQTGDWVAVPETDDIAEADPNTVADHNEAWGERRAILNQLETRCRNVERALEKITANTFGVCEISGEPIEPERLDANPAARTNIANRDRERELPL